MVDYTREMRRGRTLQDRERELQPINKQLDDERVMIKDYTHDQVVAARAAGERPFDLERERKVSAVMKQEREKVIELFEEEEEPQEVLDESLQVELDIQDQIDEEEEEAKERLRAFELIAEMRAQEAAEILAKEREGHPMKDPSAVLNKQIGKSTKAVEEFRKEIEKDLPNVDLDKVVLQKTGKCLISLRCLRNLARKPCKNVCVRSNKIKRNKRLSSMNFSETAMNFLYKEKPRLRLFLLC